MEFNDNVVTVFTNIQKDFEPSDFITPIIMVKLINKKIVTYEQCLQHKDNLGSFLNEVDIAYKEYESKKKEYERIEKEFKEAKSKLQNIINGNLEPHSIKQSEDYPELEVYEGDDELIFTTVLKPEANDIEPVFNPKQKSKTLPDSLLKARGKK